MKRWMIRIWGVWDWVYFRFNRMQYVSKKDNVFRVIRKTYKGPPLMAQDGSWIYTGDEIIKIHLYNYDLAKRMSRFSSDVAFVLYLKRCIHESLIGLNEYIDTLPDHQRIKAIIGTSMLHKGAERYGFIIYDVEQTLSNYVKSYLFKLIYLLMHPQGLLFLRNHGTGLQSKHLVMSVQELSTYTREDRQKPANILHRQQERAT